MNAQHHYTTPWGKAKQLRVAAPQTKKPLPDLAGAFIVTAVYASAPFSEWEKKFFKPTIERSWASRMVL